jgi:putative ABC transport system permease protein
MLRDFNKLRESILIAWKALVAHKARTLLTVLGVSIGISTIIIILSTGQGLRNIIMSQLAGFGSDTVFVEIKIPDTNDLSGGINMVQGVTIDTLKIEEMEELRNNPRFPEIKEAYGAQMGQDFAVYKGEEVRVTTFATNNSFIDIDSINIDKGRFFSDDEEKSMSKLAVIGSVVAEKLFRDEDPIDKSFKMGNFNWRVVGVLESKGENLGLNYDKQVFIPLRTSEKMITGQDFISYFVVQAKDPNQQDLIKQLLTDYLREKHDVEEEKEEDFRITTMAETLDMIDVILGGIRLLLGAIAAISLLVGGIGIMNIMLVSVSERTKEIGLRKSIGAKNSNILSQFLWEAIVVTGIGGVIGIISGLLFTALVVIGANAAGFEWQLTISIPAIIMGLSVSVFSGIVFGLYPAMKAAKMDPIVALRKE